MKICIVVSDYYKDISKNLLKGSIDELKKKNYRNIKIKFVSGAFEIPNLISRNLKKFDAFIALGCIIKGETDHYEVVKKVTYSQIYRTAYNNMLPLASALLTVESFSQALERSDKRKRNLGGQAAKVCLQLIKKINE